MPIGWRPTPSVDGVWAGAMRRTRLHSASAVASNRRRWKDRLGPAECRDVVHYLRALINFGNAIGAISALVALVAWVASGSALAAIKTALMVSAGALIVGGFLFFAIGAVRDLARGAIPVKDSVVVLPVIALFGIVAASTVNQFVLEHDFETDAVWGYAIGAVSWAFLAFTLGRWALQHHAREASGRVRCPYCAELVRRDARICRFCGRELSESSPTVTA
jgi:hypothetical protein